jgi:thiol-disulfide isomerase/thioredoxin
MRRPVSRLRACAFIWAAPILLLAQTACTPREKPIEDAISGLRSLPDANRARETRVLAARIRALPSAPHKLDLALDLASRATEGDFGRDTLQAVTTTLADAIRDHPGAPDAAYDELAQLVRFEHMQASIDDPKLRAAFARLAALDARRQNAAFTLADLSGKQWTLTALRGHVVLLNFWATWCPPCRKEIPDLNALQDQFRPQGLVVLGIDNNEDAATVGPFVAAQKMRYPVLLDPGGKITDLFQVTSIPKTFIYDRDGTLAAQSIDMRTRAQFLALLAQAGLR